MPSLRNHEMVRRTMQASNVTRWSKAAEEIKQPEQHVENCKRVP